MKTQEKDTVDAGLLYLADRETTATYMASEAGGDIPEHLGEYQRQIVSINNARSANANFSLDREGFRLIEQVSKVTDFYDDEQVTAIYETEVKQSIFREFEELGEAIARIELFDHTRRTSSDAKRKALKIREPASIIHNDYTDQSALRTRDEFLERAGALGEKLNDSRFLIINIWRSIVGIVQQAPMTLCSANSIAPDDVVSVERIAKNHRGELQLAVWNSNHQWHYFPEMTMQEALIFKTFDSAQDERARYTIHTAFDDPNSPDNASARESLETRCLVFLR